MQCFKCLAYGVQRLQVQSLEYCTGNLRRFRIRDVVGHARSRKNCVDIVEAARGSAAFPGTCQGASFWAMDRDATLRASRTS